MFWNGATGLRYDNTAKGTEPEVWRLELDDDRELEEADDNEEEEEEEEDAGEEDEAEMSDDGNHG